MINNFPTILNFNQLFLRLNRFICNYLLVLPDHWSRYLNLFSRIKLHNKMVRIPSWSHLPWHLQESFATYRGQPILISRCAEFLHKNELDQ